MKPNSENVTKKVVVLGGGAAGLIAAIACLNANPAYQVSIVRSRSIGHIMVGEGTFASTPTILHEKIGIDRGMFCEKVEPTLKLGIRFLWGSREYFDFPFYEEYDGQIFPNNHKPWGYYHLDGINDSNTDIESILQGNSTLRHGYHFENARFVTFLEEYFVDKGGYLIEGEFVGAERTDRGVRSLSLKDGRKVHGDFFIDASGFSGLLINQELSVPYISLADTLFCNRAVVGGWERGANEKIKNFTTAETMDSGWCWQIEHRRRVNRGYVYSNEFLSDDEAVDELAKNNPLIDKKATRIVPFEARYSSAPWKDNVVAIGNASGFVEPLEATNIQVISTHALHISRLIDSFDTGGQSVADEYNSFTTQMWREIRDFIALHYKFNKRLNTNFWQHVQNETPLGDLSDYVKNYQRYGPISYLGSDQEISSRMFGADGCLAVMLGMKVPWNSCEIK